MQLLPTCLTDANITARVYQLRILIISVIAGVVIGPIAHSDGLPPLWLRLLFSCLLLIHHIASLFRLKYFYAYCDFLLVCVELVGEWRVHVLTVSWSCITVIGSGYIATYFAEDLYGTSLKVTVSRNGLIVALSLQFASLDYAFLWRIPGAYEGFSKSFDFCYGCDMSNRTRSPFAILFGRPLWSSPLRGEREVVKALRAVIAIGSLAGILVFGVYAIIMSPIHQGGLIPAKTYYTSNIVAEAGPAPLAWHIYALIDVKTRAVSVENASRAFNVTPLWSDNANDTMPCTFTNQSFFKYSHDIDDSENLDNAMVQANFRVAEYVCQNPPVLVDNLGHVEHTLYLITPPELLITIDFSALWGGASHSIISTRPQVVSIMLGLTDNLDDVRSGTLSVPLLPGMHLLGSVSRKVRRRFNSPVAAAFGGLSSSRTFIIADIVGLIPDTSPLINNNQSTATLRLFGQYDGTEWPVIEDYVDNSVWSGFAATGGIWTFISGIFALLFGSSLMFAVFGTKPLSLFGIAHFLQKDQIREAWRVDFPRVRTEGGVPGSEEAGLLALIRERLVDLGPIVMDDKECDSKEPQTDIESQCRTPSPSMTYQPVNDMELTPLTTPTCRTRSSTESASSDTDSE